MASVIPIPLLRCLVSRRCGGGALTASLSSSSRQALGSSFSSRYMSTTEERQGSTASESGRFSDEIEELIAQAGAKADRGAKAAGSGGSVGSVGDAVDRDETLGGSADDEGLEGQGKAKVSLRAQKFRSMIKKFMPEKKVVVLKAFSPSREPLVDNLGRSYGLGRRKTSTARVWISLSEGQGGVFTVNSTSMIDYFPRDHLQNEILKPLELTEKLGGFHVRCTAKGGGQAGQAGAIRLGLSRALEAHDPWLRKILKKAGMMERDSRKVERKKPGLKKARKAPQWVKR